MIMTQKNDDDLVKELRELVVVQDKRVTFNFLSRKYGISVFRSQELIQKLKEQLKKDGRANEIVVSYVIAGYMDDTSNTERDGVRDDCYVKTIKIMHVDESELDDCKKSFSKVTGVTVKSIRGSNVSLWDRSLENTLTIETRDNHFESPNYRQASPMVSKADISQSPKKEKKVDILDEDSSNDSLKPPDNSSQKTSHSSKSSACKEEPECSIANGTSSNKQSSNTPISNGNGVSSDDDEEPITKKRQPKIEKSDTDDEEIVVPKKRRRVKAYNIDSEEEGDEVEKDQENEETLEISNSNRKQKPRATTKEEKERDKQRKMNGKVKVKQDDPGEPHELIEQDEVDVDEDGYAVTRKVKRAVKKETAEVKEEKAKPDMEKRKKSTTSPTVLETESHSSQTKKKLILSTSQKKITDFFSKPKK